MGVSKKLASSVFIFGLFWICTFGDWHSVVAFGDDSVIPIEWVDEEIFEDYILPYAEDNTYTLAEFIADTTKMAVSQVVSSSDDTTFTSIIGDIAVSSWEDLKALVGDLWIDLSSGRVSGNFHVSDDFAGTLDARLKSTGSPAPTASGFLALSQPPYVVDRQNQLMGRAQIKDGWVGAYSSGSSTYYAYLSLEHSTMYLTTNTLPTNTNYLNIPVNLSASYLYGSITYYYGTSASLYGSYSGSLTPFSSLSELLSTFYGSISSEGSWNGTGYYRSSSPSSVTLPSIPRKDWKERSKDNFVKYGPDFVDVDVTTDPYFNLPLNYAPYTINYDVPYWLVDGDETSVDWVNINFDDVTMPSVELDDGDGSFFQNLFLALPVGFSVLILGVMLCYLIFLML